MNSQVLSAYLKYMIDIHMLLGAKNRTVVAQLAAEVLQFEKELAKVGGIDGYC